MSSLLEAARQYLSWGWAVIPTVNKIPCISYTELPHFNPTSKDCFDYYLKQFEEHSEAQGIALIVNPNMLVLDLDSSRTEAEFEAITKNATGIKTARGSKYIFVDRRPDLIDTCASLRDRAGSAKFHIREDVEIILEGMLCELPPGLHPSGQRYEWINEPIKGFVTPLPDVLFNEVVRYGETRREGKNFLPGELERLLQGLSEGEGRNEAAIRIAGHLIGKNNNWNVVESFLKSWNQKNNPPLSDNELSGILESAHRYYDEKQEIKTCFSTTVNQEALNEVKEMTEAEINLLKTNFAQRKLKCDLPDDHFITQFVKYADRMTDGYQDYKILGGFWLLSSLTQRKPYIDLATSADGIFLNVWTQFIGFSSISRKTTVIDIARMFFAYAQGEPLTDTDYSLEGYLETLAETPILAMINDEVSTVFQKMNQKYNAGYNEFECKLYDCNSQNKRLASGGKKEPKVYPVKDPYITKLYGTTFVKYKRSMTIPDFDSGFGFRFVYTAPTYDFKQRPPRLRTAEDIEERSKMEARTAQLFELFNQSAPFAMGVTPEAFDYYIKTDFETQNEIKYKTNQELLGQAWSRYSVYILKFAALIEIGKKSVSRVITVESIKIATSMVLDYFLPTLCDVYNLLTVDPVNNKIDKILEALKDFKGIASHSVLLRKTRLESKEFRSLISTMVESDQIELISEKNPKNGKITTYYHYLECDEIEFKNPSSPNSQIPLIPRFTDTKNTMGISENLDFLKESEGMRLDTQTVQYKKIQILTDSRIENNVCESGNLENLGISVNLDSSTNTREVVNEYKENDKNTPFTPVVCPVEDAARILDEEGIY